MLTPADLTAVKAAVRNENAELAEVMGEVLSHFFDAMNARLGEVEKSLGLLIDGQVLVEKALAYGKPAEDDEPWRESLREDDR